LQDSPGSPEKEGVPHPPGHLKRTVEKRHGQKAPDREMPPTPIKGSKKNTAAQKNAGSKSKGNIKSRI